MPVSIFNDVIGPVMRGPSSSHCAAALRIGRLARDLMDGSIEHVKVEFDNSGSLPTTHTGQGSDMGLFGGLLGWEADDERLPDGRTHLEQAGISIEFVYGDYGDVHPNTYRLTIRNAHGIERSLIAISTGGGMIEVQSLDGISVKLDGGYDQTLVYLVDGAAINVQEVSTGLTSLGVRDVAVVSASHMDALLIQSAQRLSDDELAQVVSPASIQTVIRLNPVLPIRSHASDNIPFLTCAEMEAFNSTGDKALWELAVEFESRRGAISQDEVLQRMVSIVQILKKSLRSGLAGTDYEDRVLGFQSGKFAQQMDQGRLIDGGVVNQIVLYTTALMEVKSSMGVIVAAPTAGACAALPATCLALGETLQLSDQDIAKGMLAAGMIGVFIAHAWSFAAEVGGCQAEGGSASAMAAAAAVTYQGGTQKQATAAASMALQNMLGLICDPVANRVEAPCLGKNVMAASNAICTANMALSGFDAVIPLDETIDAARRVSKLMPREHRCTGLGGLATTPTSLKLLEKMECGSGGCASCG